MNNEILKVDIIVPSYKPKSDLLSCIDSILLYSGKHDILVTVVDSSPYPIDCFVESFFSDKRFRLHKSERRLFPGEARNLGANSSSGDIIMFTDADCVVEKCWIDKLVNCLLEGNDACGGSIENGTPLSYFGTAEYLSEFSHFSPRSKSRNERFVPTCNMAVWRKDYYECGGLSPVEKGSDVEFGFRLKEKGKTIRFVPEAEVAHLNRTSIHSFCKNQFSLGKGFAINYVSGKQPLSKMRNRRSFRLAIPLIIGPGRLFRISKRCLLQKEVLFSQLCCLIPGLLTGAFFFHAGFLAAFRQRKRKC